MRLPANNRLHKMQNSKAAMLIGLAARLRQYRTGYMPTFSEWREAYSTFVTKQREDNLIDRATYKDLTPISDFNNFLSIGSMSKNKTQLKGKVEGNLNAPVQYLAKFIDLSIFEEINHTDGAFNSEEIAKKFQSLFQDYLRGSGTNESAYDFYATLPTEVTTYEPREHPLLRVFSYGSARTGFLGYEHNPKDLSGLYSLVREARGWDYAGGPMVVRDLLFIREDHTIIDLSDWNGFQKTELGIYGAKNYGAYISALDRHVYYVENCRKVLNWIKIRAATAPSGDPLRREVLISLPICEEHRRVETGFMVAHTSESDNSGHADGIGGWKLLADRIDDWTDRQAVEDEIDMMILDSNSCNSKSGVAEYFRWRGVIGISEDQALIRSFRNAFRTPVRAKIHAKLTEFAASHSFTPESLTESWHEFESAQLMLPNSHQAVVSDDTATEIRRHLFDRVSWGGEGTASVLGRIVASG